jgi:hypothetical protein
MLINILCTSVIMEEFETKIKKLINFKSGAKRDDNKKKGAYELISPLALRRLALVYERGIEQKGARTWEKGIPFSRCVQSAIRHIFQYLEGMRDEDHLMQACWNLIAIAHFEECIKRRILPKELNDLPKYFPKK